jgi:hypothetical protein
MARALLHRVKDVLPHSFSQGILAAGGLFLIGMVVYAVIPYGQNPMTPVAANQARAVVAAAPAPAQGVTGLAGAQPFVPTPPVEFGGRVTEILTVGLEMGWGQVHIWINDGTGKLQEVSLAPQSYLQQIGCPPLTNMRVSGTGYRFDPNRPNSVLYAKTITVAGTVCRLRDDEGLALWINPTQ